jgi:hypothetical protein
MQYVTLDPANSHRYATERFRGRPRSSGRGIYPNERSYTLPDRLRSADTRPGCRGRPGRIGRTCYRTRPRSTRKTCGTLSFAFGGRPADIGREIAGPLPRTARPGPLGQALRGRWQICYSARPAPRCVIASPRVAARAPPEGRLREASSPGRCPALVRGLLRRPAGSSQ